MKKLVLMAALCLAATGAMAQTHSHADGKEHSHDDHGHSHGKPQDLGTTTVEGLKFQAYQLGALETEGVFEVVLAKGSAKPKAVRFWVGTESAEGSVKARAEGDGNAFEAHVELPKPMPKNAQLWVDIQPAEGKKVKTAFDLKK
jgi:hypothetical protein